MNQTTPTLLGRVENLFICAEESMPMRPVERVQAIAGQGLQDDRYGSKRGTFSKGETEPVSPGQQITLIEAEAVEAVPREYEIALDPIETRRNVLTRGVALNHLVGREFHVGDEVVLRGIRLCEPCGHLEKLTREGMRKSLIHRGGLRAEIVRGGEVRLGDSIASRD